MLYRYINSDEDIDIPVIGQLHRIINTPRGVCTKSCLLPRDFADTNRRDNLADGEPSSGRGVRETQCLGVGVSSRIVDLRVGRKRQTVPSHSTNHILLKWASGNKFIGIFIFPREERQSITKKFLIIESPTIDVELFTIRSIAFADLKEPPTASVRKNITVLVDHITTQIRTIKPEINNSNLDTRDRDLHIFFQNLIIKPD